MDIRGISLHFWILHIIAFCYFYTFFNEYKQIRGMVKIKIRIRIKIRVRVRIMYINDNNNK